MSISEICQVWSVQTKHTCHALRERGIDTDDIRSLLVTRLDRALKVPMDSNNNINFGGNEKRSQVALIRSEDANAAGENSNEIVMMPVGANNGEGVSMSLFDERAGEKDNGETTDADGQFRNGLRMKNVGHTSSFKIRDLRVIVKNVGMSVKEDRAGRIMMNEGDEYNEDHQDERVDIVSLKEVDLLASRYLSLIHI